MGRSARPLPTGHKPTVIMSNNYPEGPGVYADVLLDDWFKRSFQEQPGSERMMLLFLREVIPERNITKIHYAPQEKTNQNPEKKSIRVDVECFDDAGRRFVVEIQRDPQAYFFDRAIFNSTFAIQRQLSRGARSYRFPPVYFIGITRFSLHKNDNRYLYRYSIKDDQTGEQMTDDLHYIFLEIPKCAGGKDRPLIEKFGHALGNLWLYKSRPQGYDEELLQLLFDSANISKFTPQEKIKYDNDMTTRRDILNQIDFAREEGAANKILEIARAMLADGVDISLISKYSGLTKDEIAAL
ncbi:MAG: Rpn family recombination-promoting nuclease/putative transposase [Bacteroidales bacterium]|nr:Rpn family recombination-promoting nuclease/putative transposase [Bacteroidales bacterium]